MPNGANNGFEARAMAGLKRLPKLPAHVWDDMNLKREPGDQRRAPFKGAQSKSSVKIADTILASTISQHGSFDKAVEAAPVKKVRFSSLRGLQPGVDAEVVKRKIAKLAESDTLNAPIVASFRSRLYLMDGYHNVTALKLGGVKGVEAKVVQV
jgi:hypothetical protein